MDLNNFFQQNNGTFPTMNSPIQLQPQQNTQVQQQNETNQEVNYAVDQLNNVVKQSPLGNVTNISPKDEKELVDFLEKAKKKKKGVVYSIPNSIEEFVEQAYSFGSLEEISDQEWIIKKHWYRACCKHLILPPFDNTSGILTEEFSTKLGIVAQQANFDNAIAKYYVDTIDIDIKNLEKGLYSSCRDALIQINSKATQKDIESAVKNKIINDKYKTYNTNAFDALAKWRERSNFLTAVLKTLDQKKNDLITRLSNMKLEASMTGFSNGYTGNNKQAYAKQVQQELDTQLNIQKNTGYVGSATPENDYSFVGTADEETPYGV